MRITMITGVVVVSLFLTMTTQLLAQDLNLSIYEIQYTEDPNGNSYYDGNTVDCNGGVVIHKWSHGRERLILYDPNYPEGWGGIPVKGPYDSNVFEHVNLGNWVKLQNVLVSDPSPDEYDEYKTRGNTTLFYEGYSSKTVLDTAYELPVPLVVSINEIAAPIYDDDNDIWAVIDHNAEKYEAMYIEIIDITVGEMGFGKDSDNYELYMANDPNIYCWASDYMNIDNPDDETPHPIVESGLQLCSVSGILEQYTKLSDGWDYYQLLTTEVEDFETEQIADFDGDCDVDFADYSSFAGHWLQNGCAESNSCGGADLFQDANDVVDIYDILVFTQNWLEGK